MSVGRTRSCRQHAVLPPRVYPKSFSGLPALSLSKELLKASLISKNCCEYIVNRYQGQILRSELLFAVRVVVGRAESSEGETLGVTSQHCNI
jgi:hypothetical protein